MEITKSSLSLYSKQNQHTVMRLRFSAACLLVVFALAVSYHSYADTKLKDTYGYVAKEKKSVSGIDQLFVCTADVPSIFVLPPVAYKPARNVEVEKPIRSIVPNSNSPPRFWA